MQQSRRRTNLLLGFIVLLIALVAVANAFNLFSPSLYDMILRAWPALLIALGLAYLLRGRIPLGGTLALVLTVALTVGVGAVAFSSRAEQQRNENQQAIDQPLPDTLALLRVRLNTLDTDVEIIPVPDGASAVRGSFIGSLESSVGMAYEEAPDSSATLTIVETRPNPVPMLETVGRGTLQLEVPSNIPLDVELIADAGAVNLNMSSTRLERMNLNLMRGNALVTLPDYDPIFSEDDDTLGTLAVRSGDLTVVVPATVAARLELDRGGSGIEPEYDPSAYNFLFNRLLEARAIENAEFVVQYLLVAPNGRIRLETGGGAPADPA